MAAVAFGFRFPVVLSALLLVSCGAPEHASIPEGDAIEICLLCYRKSGDGIEQAGMGERSQPSTVSIRLYNRAWNVSRPPGGPFEVVARPPRLQVVAMSIAWNDERHIVYQEDITGLHGDDPRWEIFMTCEEGVIAAMGNREGVQTKVVKEPPPFPK